MPKCSTATALGAAMLLTAVFYVPAFGSGGSAADRDCSDFDTQRQAQRYFISRGGPARDPDNLDSDGDGIACETNPCPCQFGGGDGGGATPQRIRGRILRVTDGDTVSVRAFDAPRFSY